MLYIFSGLPGVGKTTLATALARRYQAVHLRIDTIECALSRSSLAIHPAEDTGYVVGYAVATDNLRNGLAVVADSVNPLEITRRAWHQCALDAGVRFVDIEVRCSDEHEQRRRIETRRPDIEGHQLPNWSAVCERVIEPWTSERIQIDTASYGAR